MISLSVLVTGSSFGWILRNSAIYSEITKNSAIFLAGDLENKPNASLAAAAELKPSPDTVTGVGAQW